MVSRIVKSLGYKTFNYCIINNDSEFDEKTEDFPTKILNPNDNDKEIPNINDDNVTQSLKVDFSIN